ncbi:hypothetical protein CC_1414 [Caulobacter vibrioides CB15]|uniref:Uncharacterized protein n=1 Tax=Caulobacter vibrioides (strain ATCC 19089 / CIP 103742 / CB 15) TaxID=190650 RepID=Q9A8E0_CAUVC|nr:hypothetical protein CC_1414 [Caulobacter vibrioides CB15]
MLAVKHQPGSGNAARAVFDVRIKVDLLTARVHHQKAIGVLAHPLILIDDLETGTRRRIAAVDRVRHPDIAREVHAEIAVDFDGSPLKRPARVDELIAQRKHQFAALGQIQKQAPRPSRIHKVHEAVVLVQTNDELDNFSGCWFGHFSTPD